MEEAMEYANPTASVALEAQALETTASFDPIALAEELRNGVELLIQWRPQDEAYHDRVREAFDGLCSALEGVDGSSEVIEVLKPVSKAAADAKKAARTPDESTAPAGHGEQSARSAQAEASA
jgi:hypothetical protein